MKFLKKFKLFESSKIKCAQCGHSWSLTSGGEDPYTCHKCGGVHADTFKFAGEPSDWYKSRVGSENVEEVKKDGLMPFPDTTSDKVTKVNEAKGSQLLDNYKGLSQGHTSKFDSYNDILDALKIAKKYKINFDEDDFEINRYSEYPCLTFHGGKLIYHKGGSGHIIPKKEFIEKMKYTEYPYPWDK